MKEKAIEVKNLSISYGSTQVIEDISFSLDKGGILAIVGPNGSGKSSLVKALLGLMPARGTIKLLGGTQDEARKKIGYVPQQFSFDRTFPITVFEFLQISCPSCPREQILEQLAHLNVKNVETARLGTLSGGQLQRVLIVRAMLHTPEILFLDEPASGIDIGGEENFFSLIAHLHKEHTTTIVMVSHELDVVHKLASQVLCINKKLICSGTPEAVLTQETLQKLYGKEVSVFHHKKNHHKES